MPIISNSIQNNGGSSQGIRSQTRTYRSGNSTLHLREGQTLRGVISDIHGNDITLSMEVCSSDLIILYRPASRCQSVFHRTKGCFSDYRS